ncbi:MAG: hypothetical protein P1U63_02790 [Coxiellaceae bacterium]|nr:hypothetical protein [Coxiellaceae bacterium]
MRVLLYIDQKRRDEYGMLRLRDQLLSDKSIEVKVSGKLDFIFTVAHWQPHVIVYGKVDCYHGDWLRCIDNAIIISLNTEQGFDREKSIFTTFMLGHTYVRPMANECVDYFCLFSQRTKDVLKKWLPEDKLIVTGSPRVLAKKPATEPRPVGSQLVIGISLGADIGDRASILSYFANYKDADNFSNFGNLQGYFAYHVLERMWLDFLINSLSVSYKLIVRPRFCNRGDFPYKHKNITYDWSNDPTYIVKKCDLIISGQSSMGIDSLIAGVPVISIVNLINPGFKYEKVLSRNYVKPLWQPRTCDELFKLVEARLRGELALCADIPSYLTTVTDNFFGGNEEDLSLIKISSLIKKEATMEKGASFDSAVYKKLFGKNKEWLVLKLMAAVKLKFFYKALFKVLQYKINSLSKKDNNYSIYIDFSK